MSNACDEMAAKSPKSFRDGAAAVQGSTLRVLHVVAAPVAVPGGRVGVNGPERSTLDAIPRLRELGIDSIVAYPSRGRLWGDFNHLGIAVVAFEPASKWDVGAVRRLATVVHDHKIDVVHSQGPASLDLLAAFAARAQGKPFVVTRHSMIEDFRHISALRKRAYLLADRATLALAQRIIVISRHGQQTMQGKGHAIAAKTRLVYNGINVEKFGRCIDRRSSKVTEAVKFGFVGRLHPEKGCSDFVSIISNLHRSDSRVRGVLIGDGSMRDALLRQIAAEGLDGVVVLQGHTDSVADLLSELDVFVLPSRREGMSIAIAEAMAAGLPIIATRVGGTAEQVFDDENGYLFDPEDTAGMLKGCSLLLRDPALRLRLGQRSAQIARGMFDLRTITEAHAQLYLAAAS